MESINTTCVTNPVSLGVAQLLFTKLLTTLVKSYCDLNPIYPQDQSSSVQDHDEYDFIVVGAGSAGSVIANRLSEIPSWRVLLIEAGADPPVESNIPALWPSLMGSKYDWNYKFEADHHSCRSMKNKQCICPRGKLLGGSSSVSVLAYVRANPKDFDKWEEVGNPGWGYKNVSEYFKKMERADEPQFHYDSHGHDGYIDVQYGPRQSLFKDSVIRDMIKTAAIELGYDNPDDHVPDMKSGVYDMPFTIKDGTRVNTARAYLVPAKDRKNLVVMKESQVTKLLINNEKHVYGVEIFSAGKYKSVVSKKEVIVCAGVINSPQLLMLSGIGPKDHLQSFGIKVVQDLKVGYNLQDHVVLHNTFIKLNVSLEHFNEIDLFYYYLTRRNDAFAIPTIDTMLFADTRPHQAIDYPDIAFVFAKNPPGTLESTFFNDDTTKAVVNANRDSYMLGILPKVLRPSSRGRVLLKNSDPFTAPLIDGGLLTNDEDMMSMIRGLKIALKMTKTKAFEGSSLYLVPVPECDGYAINEDEYYMCYIRNFATTLYHSCGSCKMGPIHDPDAVVDPTLKVHGVSGVRVTDASIMPFIPSGSANVPTIMIGEKAADLIKSDWLYRFYSDEL